MVNSRARKLIMENYRISEFVLGKYGRLWAKVI